ncbi:MAG: two-component system LytT family response regulator [Cryomorphaceae bacterium]|jgi:two-component system LytT family response regulator
MKAIVVEDSRLARQGLLRMLEQFSSLQVVGSAEHPSSAMDLIDEFKPDVVFLDIHMPGETGFDLLDKLDYTPQVIFTTAYSEYAYRSFDYNAVDYLLKPISKERLAEAVGKLSGSESPAGETVSEPLERNSKIFIKDGDDCHLVTLSDIRYFESCKNYVRVFFGDKNAYIKKPLSIVEKRLPAQLFFKVSRQFVVNLFEIKSIDESIGDGYDITMGDNKVISVSRRNAVELKRRLSF